MRAAGPLGRYVTDAPDKGARVRLGDGGDADPNAQTLLRRVCWVPDANGSDDKVANKNLRALVASRMFPGGLLDAADRRRTAAVQRLAERGAYVKELVVQPVDRMIIGFGDETPSSEVGFRLHGTYGTPILPGQSIKGVTAAAAREDDEDRDQAPLVFGHEKSRGSVMFLDALPVARGAGGRVTPDVLTPHGDEWEQPTPVHFLTATDALHFRVHVVAMGEGGEVLLEDDEVYAGKWLREGLEEIGIGAKTSSGYGYMKTVTR